MRATWNVFTSAIKTHLSLTLVRSTFQIVTIVQPIVIATIAFMIYRRNGQESDFLTFVVLGSGIAGMWSAIVFSSAGDIARERFYGTLRTLVGSPTPIIVVMMGKIMANGFLSLFSVVISFVFSAVAFGIPINIPYPLAFVGTMFIFLISVNLFALVLSAIFLLSRSTAVLQNFLEYPILIVTGVMFNIELLPIWAQSLGWLIPLTWGSKALRLIIQEPLQEPLFLQAVGLEVALLFFYLLLAFILFRVIERRVRVTATLDIY